MSQDALPSSESLARLNEQLALQLLDIDRLLEQQTGAEMPFGWERLATGSTCYRALARTGLFGEEPTDHAGRVLQAMAARQIRLDKFDWLPLNQNWHEASFAQSAAFLDVVSEWIRCDDIYSFLLASPTGGPSSLVRRVIFGRMRYPRLYPKGSLVAFSLSNESSLRGLCKYVELAEDLFDLVSDPNFRFAEPWFWWCMSYWFQAKFSDKARLWLDPRFDRRDLWRFDEEWDRKSFAILYLKEIAETRRAPEIPPELRRQLDLYRNETDYQ